MTFRFKRSFFCEIPGFNVKPFLVRPVIDRKTLRLIILLRASKSQSQRNMCSFAVSLSAMATHIGTMIRDHSHDHNR